MSDVQIQDRGLVSMVLMSRPPANYFDRDMLAGIADAVEAAAARGARAIVLAAEGRHFCAGADFGSEALRTDRRRAAEEIYRAGLRLFESSLPIVAAVQGAAVGGGLGLACAADFRVASTASRFHANFAHLGFHHGFALSETLPRLIGEQKALEVLVTATPLSGTRAHDLGLVDRLTSPGDERSEAIALAEAIAASAPLAVRSIRETMRKSLRERKLSPR